MKKLFNTYFFLFLSSSCYSAETKQPVPQRASLTYFDTVIPCLPADIKNIICGYLQLAVSRQSIIIHGNRNRLYRDDELHTMALDETVMTVVVRDQFQQLHLLINAGFEANKPLDHLTKRPMAQDQLQILACIKNAELLLPSPEEELLKTPVAQIPTLPGQ